MPTTGLTPHSPPLLPNSSWLLGPFISVYIERHHPADPATPKHPSRPIQCSSDIESLTRPFLERQDREYMLLVPIDTKHQPIGIHILAIGTLSSCLVHPREVFKAAIGVNAHAIVLVHNHPSGDFTPSAEDRTLTHRLYRAGKILGISCLDHLIIGVPGYFSFADHDLLRSEASA